MPVSDMYRAYSPTGMTAGGILQMKANVPAREVEGYAATWTPDDVGDRIDPHAFDQTIIDRHEKPLRELGRSNIKVLWQHENPIGVLKVARTDEIGLWIKAYISNTRHGDDALQLMADGAVDRMSIGYMVQDSTPEGRIRLLKLIDLWEVSFVTFPANPAAIITGVKSMTGGVPDIQFRAQTFAIAFEQKENDDMAVTLRTKAGAVISGKNMERIKDISTMCMKALDHCHALMGVEPTGGEKARPSRDEDAGGRGEPPDNHDVDRDSRQGKDGGATMECPHCGTKLHLRGNIGPMGVPEPEPGSIAGSSFVPSLGQPTPEPDSIAGSSLVPSLGQPEPKPDSIAGLIASFGQPAPEPDSIASMEIDDGGYYDDDGGPRGNTGPLPVPEAEPDSVASILAGSTWGTMIDGPSSWTSPSYTFDDFVATPHAAPGERPGGGGPYPVPAARPYSIASSDETSQLLVGTLKSMQARLSSI